MPSNTASTGVTARYFVVDGGTNKLRHRIVNARNAGDATIEFRNFVNSLEGETQNAFILVKEFKHGITGELTESFIATMNDGMLQGILSW